jgi:excisionase family DNA binding protein
MVVQKLQATQCEGQASLEMVRPPLLVSKRDAAALLSLCLRSIDNLIARKELPCRRIGKRVLIPYSALVAFARRDHPTVGASTMAAKAGAQL